MYIYIYVFTGHMEAEVKPCAREFTRSKRKSRSGFFPRVSSTRNLPLNHRQHSIGKKICRGHTLNDGDPSNLFCALDTLTPSRQFFFLQLRTRRLLLPRLRSTRFYISYYVYIVARNSSDATAACLVNLCTVKGVCFA